MVVGLHSGPLHNSLQTSVHVLSALVCRCSPLDRHVIRSFSRHWISCLLKYEIHYSCEKLREELGPLQSRRLEYLVHSITSHRMNWRELFLLRWSNLWIILYLRNIWSNIQLTCHYPSSEASSFSTSVSTSNTKPILNLIKSHWNSLSARRELPLSKSLLTKPILRAWRTIHFTSVPCRQERLG